ncbi:hypothetical protein KGP36_03340 [Patescibacteria group bacterium]|nr:hypothetical protein [Patescibacteria group bacterium]
MPSPDNISVDLPIPNFGGLVSGLLDPQALPLGASPYNRDIAFAGVNPSGTSSGTGTRPGMKPFYAAPFAGNPTVNYLKTFVDSMDIFHLLSLDGLGNMRDETPCPEPPGVPALIGTVLAGCLCQSDSLINREWMAFSAAAHPGFGVDIPRQWDGANFDRVSQGGPGAPPSVADYNNSFDLEASPSGILPVPGQAVSSVTQDGNTVTVTMTLPLLTIFGANLGLRGLQVGDSVKYTGDPVPGYNVTAVVTAVLPPNQFQFYITATGLANSGGGTMYFGIAAFNTTGLADAFPIYSEATVAGAGVAAYNTTWNVRAVVNGGGHTTITAYAPVYNQGNSGNGTIGVGGDIDAGVHQVSVAFITRENYITKPSPWATWTAAGGLQAQLNNIPIGPPNVIARVLLFTSVITPPATTGSFFYFDGSVVVNANLTYPSMVINDNVTTTYLVNFSDAVLLNGQPGDDLFNLVELGECSQVTAYSGRLFWCGERAKVQNFINLSFDGGWNGNTPLGWSYASAGGSKSADAYWGDAYRITGDGTISPGTISQSAYQDYLGVPILSVNTAYSMRVRLQKSAGLVAGQVVIEFYSANGGGTLGYVQIDHSQIGTEYSEFILPVMNAQATIPADLVLIVTGAGTPTLGEWVDVDCLEIFPTNQPYYNTQVRCSYALDPESYNQLTGIMNVGAENGYAVKATFNLLDNKLYMVKELGLFSTADDGSNEPSSWTINTVSATMGTGSARGVGIGDSWAIIAHKTGVYIFWGGEPVKISQEIQPDWDRINWAYDQTIYVVVDTINKRIHIGAPVDGSTVPNAEFVCDYAQLANAEGQVSGQDIAAHPQVYYSIYAPDRVMAPGKSRKWTIWNLSMNCGALTIRTDGSYHLLRGNATGTGKVYDQDVNQLSDDGVAIHSQYQTAYFPQSMEEQQLQLGAHRKLLKYLTGYIYGVGSLLMTIYGPQNQRAVSLTPSPLQNPPPWDFEKNVNYIGERMSILVETNAVGSWFNLSKMIATIQREIITPVRGVN